MEQSDAKPNKMTGRRSTTIGHRNGKLLHELQREPSDRSLGVQITRSQPGSSWEQSLVVDIDFMQHV